jgi:hypothetical protein
MKLLLASTFISIFSMGISQAARAENLLLGNLQVETYINAHGDPVEDEVIGRSKVYLSIEGKEVNKNEVAYINPAYIVNDRAFAVAPNDRSLDILCKKLNPRFPRSTGVIEHTSLEKSVIPLKNDSMQGPVLGDLNSDDGYGLKVELAQNMKFHVRTKRFTCGKKQIES